MNLREFTSTLPNGGAAVFAEQLGITRFYLSQLAARQDGRLPSPELCVRMERESLGHVRRWDVRPDDWHLIWPELITARGAPPVPKHVAA